MTPDPRRSDPPAGRVGPGAQSPVRPVRQCYWCESKPAEVTITVPCVQYVGPVSGGSFTLVKDQGNAPVGLCLECQEALMAQFETQMTGEE